MKSILSLIIISFALLPSAGLAEERRKAMEFEDGMVEGMNRRSRDSLSQVGDKDRNGKKPHLYKKRTEFKEETADALRDLEKL
jgi:hypothetical protein